MLALKGFKMQNVQKTYQTDVNRKENEANTMTYTLMNKNFPDFGF